MASPRLLALLLLGLMSVALGLAASLGLASDSLGAATVAVPRCATAGLAVSPVLSGTTVASVTVAGLPVACGGATLQVTVSNGSAVGSGSGTVPSGGGSVSVTIAAAPAVTTALEADIVLTGP